MREDDYDDLRDDPDTLDALAVLEGLSGDTYAEDADVVIDVAQADSLANERRMYSGVAIEGAPVSGPFRDDFTEMRIRQAEAQEAFPRDDLAQQAAIDHAEVAELARRVEEAPRISGMPPTWTKGVIGGQMSVVPGQAPQEVATWIGENAESRPVSVAAAPTEIPDSEGSGSNALRPFLRLQFGTTRGLITADVDIGTGIQVVVPANIVHALVGLDSGGSLAYSLTVVMGYFPVIRTGTPTRTAYMNSAAGTTNQIRPAFATAVRFDRTDVSAQFTLNFKDFVGTTIYQRIVQAGQYVENPIPLYNDVYSVDVVNNGGTTNARFQWVLGGL